MLCIFPTLLLLATGRRLFQGIPPAQALPLILLPKEIAAFPREMALGRAKHVATPLNRLLSSSLLSQIGGKKTQLCIVRDGPAADNAPGGQVLE